MRLKLFTLCIFITLAPLLAVIPDRVAVTDSSKNFSELVNPKVSAYLGNITDIGWNWYPDNRVNLSPSILVSSDPDNWQGSSLKYSPPSIYTISLDADAIQLTNRPDNALTPVFDTWDGMVGAALASSRIDGQYSDVGIFPSEDHDNSKTRARTIIWLLGVGVFSLFGLQRRLGRPEAKRRSEIDCGCEDDICADEVQCLIKPGVKLNR